MKKTILIILALVLILGLSVVIHDYILGSAERKAKKELESYGVYTEDKEWYDYCIENIMDYESRIYKLKNSLTTSQSGSYNERANISLQINLCQQNLNSEISNFKSMYNDLSSKEKEKIKKIIYQKYYFDVDTIL